MIAGSVVAVLLGLTALGFILAPLLERNAARIERESATLSESREFQSRQDMLLASLKDLEDDRATDKISDEDFERAHAQLSGEVVAAMRQLDVLELRRAAGDPPPAPRAVPRAEADDDGSEPAR